MQFGYEDLKVWDRAVGFAVMVIDAAERIDTGRPHYRLLEQIEAASASVAMNIAEGKGRFSPKEFKHFCTLPGAASTKPPRCWKFSIEKPGYPRIPITN